MNNSTIDYSQIDRLLDSLDKEKRNEIMMKALEEGGKTLKRATQTKLLQKFPKASYVKGKAKKPMVESIRVIKDKDYNEVVVSIMKNYLNTFYENGSKARYLKRTHKKDDKHKRMYYKGEYRGKIQGLHFFADARKESENDVIKAIEDEIMKQINELNK